MEVSEGIVLVTCERNDEYIRFCSPVENLLIGALVGETDHDLDRSK